MKKSMVVTLVISGALLTGCDSGTQTPGTAGDYSQSLTNNTFRTGYGYWHAPYRSWYPYPYNSYWPGRGYYHGGLYTEQPYVSVITSSQPTVSGSSGGGSRNWFHSTSSGSSHSSGSISRGGFGSSGHASS